MLTLLKKEFSLSMHPTIPFMLLLSSMVLIPNYAYTVIFFYATMAIFFTCLSGRENDDVFFTLSMPIARKEVVKARIGFSVVVQLLQMALLILFCSLAQMINQAGNPAGIDANIVLLAEGFVIFGVFNLIFFCSYYKNVAKVGVSFLKASAAVFLIVAADAVITHTVPFVKGILDTGAFQFVPQKTIALAMGIAVYIILTAFSYKISRKRFSMQDL